MSHPRRTPIQLAPLFLATTLAGAQGNVIVVDDQPGPGVDFTDVQLAIDSAAEGDTILLKGGAYAPFTVSAKSLIVLAELDEGVFVDGRLTVRNLAANQSATLRGLKTGVAAEEGLVVNNNQGPVWIEDCILRGGLGDNDFVAPFGPLDSYPGARVMDSPFVSLARCDLSGGAGLDVFDEAFQTCPGGGGDGLLATNSRLALYDCNFAGGSGGSMLDTDPCGGGDGGDGLSIDGGFAFASRCSFTAGDGGNGDSDLFSCGSGGDGGDGIRMLANGPQVELLENTFQAGQGGSAGGSGCSGGAQGVSVSVQTGTETTHPGTGRKLRAASPVREQETVDLIFRGQPGDQAFALLSLEQGFAWMPPLLGVQVIGSYQVFPMGQIGATGVLVAPVAVGNIHPAAEALTVYLQMGAIDQNGEPFLGGNSAVVILDQSL